MKRRMKVYELGGKAQIKITGDWLSNFGFVPGDAIEVELCKDGSLRISHPEIMEAEHNLLNSGATSKKAR